MADKEVSVKLTLDDELSDGMDKATQSTERLNKSVESLKDSSIETNVAFMANLETLDRFGGSIAKIRGGLQDTGIVSAETAEQLMKVQGAVDLIVGSSEILIVVQRTLQKTTQTQALAMGTLAAAAGGVAAAYMAINARSEQERELFAALTGVSLGLAAAQFTLALAKYSAAVADAGPLAPVVAGIITASLAAGAVYFASLKASAETEPGEIRVVEKTGVALVHEGETIGRVSEPIRPATMPAEINVNVNGFIAPITGDELSEAIANALRGW